MSRSEKHCGGGDAKRHGGHITVVPNQTGWDRARYTAPILKSQVAIKESTNERKGETDDMPVNIYESKMLQFKGRGYKFLRIFVGSSLKEVW